MISIVLPVHNERDNLEPLLCEIGEELGTLDLEVLAVDDESTDGSLAELRRLRTEHSFLRIVTLALRSGQSAAFQAGLERVRGETVVLMDADLQNDPADVPPMLEMLKSNPECVAVVGYRLCRADSRWKRVQSKIANKIRNWVTGDRVRDIGCSLKVIRASALPDLVKFNGMHRFYPTLLRRGGGIVLETPVSHRPRINGESKYGMMNRAFVAFNDALGVRWLGRRALHFQATEEEI